MEAEGVSSSEAPRNDDGNRAWQGYLSTMGVTYEEQRRPALANTHQLVRAVAEGDSKAGVPDARESSVNVWSASARVVEPDDGDVLVRRREGNGLIDEDLGTRSP